MTTALRYHWIAARSYTNGRKGYKAIILHSSDGRKAGDIATLTEGAVSSGWYVPRDGSLYHFVADSDSAYHAGRAKPYLGNSWTIGIETEHRDGIDDWPDAQLLTIARLIVALRQKHGYLPVMRHADIAVPKGRKVDPVGFPFGTLKWQKMMTDAEAVTWVFERLP